MMRERIGSKFLEETKRRRRQILEGIPTFIPIRQFFPRLSRYMPGFIPGDLVIVTANSGVGKSRFTRFMFIKLPLKLQVRNPNFRVKIFLNSLEESEEKVEATFILSRLYRKYNTRITFYELNHFSEEPLDDDVMEQIAECKKFYDENIRPYLEVVIEPNPKKFYLRVLQYLKTVGTFYDETRREVDPFKEEFDSFEYYDPRLMVIAISDTINNYDKLSDMSWYDSIKHFSAKYCRQQLCLKCKCIVVNVQQQASDKEKLEMNKLGIPIEEKLEPSLDGLGDIKITQRDATVAFGLFHPARYGLTSHGDFNMGNMYGKYRGLFLLKTREGQFDNRNIIATEMQHGDQFVELPTSTSGIHATYSRLSMENDLSS